MAARMREQRAKASEIGEIPKPVDTERRELGRQSLRYFCETYRAPAFNLGWSEDHLIVIDLLEKTAREGGLFALAMPRGSGKTTITVTAALWSLLYGFRRWVCLIGATTPKANNLLKAIKSELRFNQLLLEDFPEACLPIRALEGQSRRATGQTCEGVETNIIWLTEELSFPTIAGSVSSGARVTVAGITGDIRGQQTTLSDGSVIRPDYVILDDPQTRESAKSPQQTDDRIATLHGDILGLAGPGVKISGVMPCTVIRRGDMADQILDRDNSPEWQGKRTQLLYGWPTNISLWHTYQELRESVFRNDGDVATVNAFYEENREAMDLGCRAAWEDRHNDDELSGIQHAMHLYFRDEEAFFAEYQNQPIETQEEDALSEDEIARRVNTLERRVVPNEADFVTAMIDVQKEMLFFAVTAWRKDFTGWCVDYGGYPDQKTTNFKYSQARSTFSKLWPKQSLEVTLRRALTELVGELCGRTWKREDGGEVSIDQLVIDANWGQSRDIVYDFCRNSPFRSIVRPSHGKYVGASTEPLNARAVRKPGKTVGTHWRLDKAKDSHIRHVLFDSNYWKSFLQSRLATETGSPGSLTLYQASPRIHKTIAKHLTAEYAVRTSGRGRECDEWKLKPDRSDNHWLDCLVGCCVTASIVGCDVMAKKKLISKQEGAPKRERRKKGVKYL